MTKNETQPAVYRLIKLKENRYVFPDIGELISEFLQPTCPARLENLLCDQPNRL